MKKNDLNQTTQEVTPQKPAETAQTDLAAQQTALQNAVNEAQAVSETTAPAPAVNATPAEATMRAGANPATKPALRQTANMPQVGAGATRPQTTTQQTQLNNEVYAQSVGTQPAQQASGGGATEVAYTDPEGNQQTGYIIDGVTYTDPNGTEQVPVGSVVTDAYGRLWYKGEDGSTEVSEVSYTDPSGVTQTGYIINGTTYTDPYGTTPVPVGSVVTTPDGNQWYKGEDGSNNVTGMSEIVYFDENGNRATGYMIDGVMYADMGGTTPLPQGTVASTADGQYVQQSNGTAYYINRSEYERNLSDLSELIRQEYAAADEAAKMEINYATQQGVDQLNRAMQDAQPGYEAAIANQLLETKQAQDAQALRNQVNGDRGGIGSAQVDSIINSGAKAREAIATQQRQLATDTARQIADLRAQGKYQEAQALLQNAQQRLAALYNEGVRLQQEYKRTEENLAAYANAYLQAGIVPPSDEMLAAIGLDRETAQNYVDTFYKRDEAQNARSFVLQMLFNGMMPDADTLQAAGISQKDAEAIIASNNSNTAWDRAIALLNAGIMPDSQMLAAAGLSQAVADEIYNKATQKSSGKTDSGGDKDDTKPEPSPDPITSYDQLSPTGQAIANRFRTVGLNVNDGTNAEIIGDAYRNDEITLQEAEFLKRIAGVSDEAWNDMISRLGKN